MYAPPPLPHGARLIPEQLKISRKGNGFGGVMGITALKNKLCI